MLHSLISPKQAIVDYRQAPDALCGLSPHLDSMRGIVSYQRGEEIYANTDPAEHWYCVISGAARKYALLSDGRRRIIDFLLRYASNPPPCSRATRKWDATESWIALNR
jgi:hypothetical protein